jgi:hypothetical protein
MIRNELIRRIHVLKRDLGLDDDTYRLVLHNISGETSCTKLQVEELNLVSVALTKMKDNRGTTGPTRKNPDQHKMISKLGYILGWSWKDIAGYVQRIAGKNSTRACNAGELSKVIRGMIGTIDARLESGEITMNHTEKFEYLQHTKHHREKEIQQ